MLQPQRYVDIPHVDLLSWTFGHRNYDLDRPILVDAKDSTRHVSYRQAKNHVRKLIAGLRAKGLRPDDGVCIHSFNNIHYTLVFLAIIGAGGRVVGSNPAYATFELRHLFATSKAKFVVVEPELVQGILPAVGEVGILRSNIFIFDTYGQGIPDGYVSWSRLLEYGEEDWLAFDDKAKSQSTIAALNSTSGTTGLPKMAAISHYSYVAQNIQLYDSGEKSYEIARLLCLPCFHAFAGPMVHVAALREGHTTYIMRKYNLEEYCDYIAQYSITELSVTPPIVLHLLALPVSKKKCLSSVRFVWCGGAPLLASVQNRLRHDLHPEGIVAQVWGMTEIGWITTMHYPEKDVSGSAGRLVPNLEAKIIDGQSQEILDECRQGEVLIRGPSIMNGYLDDIEATNRTIKDGWLYTGDIGYQKDGKWYIVDRAKELIKVRGWQVSPTELETFLRTHPAIVDAAVIGINLPGRGEVPRAYIIFDETSPSVTDREIQDFVTTSLASFKALAGGIKRVQSIPKSPSGKILRKILNETAEREVAEMSKVKRIPTLKGTLAKHGLFHYSTISSLAYYLPLLVTAAVFAGCLVLPGQHQHFMTSE